MPAPTEYQIQKALCMWLDGVPGKLPKALRDDVIYFHTPNGGSRGAAEGKRFKDIGVKAGIYDLTFLHGGGFFVLELKDKDGKLSKTQEEMWARYHHAGARGVAWANNLQSCKAWVNSWGLTVDNQPQK